MSQYETSVQSSLLFLMLIMDWIHIFF